MVSTTYLFQKYTGINFTTVISPSPTGQSNHFKAFILSSTVDADTSVFLCSEVEHTVRKVGLEPVNVVVLVDGVNGQDHLGHVEPSHILRQTVLKLTQQGQKVAAHIVVHHQILQKQKHTSLG